MTGAAVGTGVSVGEMVGVGARVALWEELGGRVASGVVLGWVGLKDPTTSKIKPRRIINIPTKIPGPLLNLTHFLFYFMDSTQGKSPKWNP